MNRLMRAIAALGAGLLFAAAWGQSQDHVKWSLDAPTGKGGDTVTLHVKAQVESGWHLYSIHPVKGEGPFPTTFTAQPPLTLDGAVTESTPHTELDPNFNLQVEFFQGAADFQVPVKLASDPKAGSIDIRFQVCTNRFCMPPKTVSLPLFGAAAPSAPSATGGAKPAAQDAYSDKVAKAKAQGLLAFVALSFGAGLLSLLTPCVFPMIPITVSFFSKRRKSEHIGYAEPIAFCGGIVGSFAVFGMLVSVLFGASGVQRFATNPWVNLGLAALFIVLALALLGIYTPTLPSGIVNRFSGAQGKGGLAAAALMGLTFTLTSFTCTVPFVGTILAGAAQGDYVYPLLGMIAYGAAFSLPFFFLALFPQLLARLPKSGSWLETVKAFMGFIEIAAAVKFLSNADLVLQTHILSRPAFLILWAIIAATAGSFLIGTLPLPHHEKPEKVGPWRFIFAVASSCVAVWLLSAVGGRSLGELEAFMPPSDSGWIKTYERALQVARQTNRPIFINFTGVTCTNCRSMEQNMFPRAEVKRLLDKYVTVELFTDRATSGDAKNKQFEEQLTGVETLPEYVELTPDGTNPRTFPGSTRDVNEFVAFLKKG